MKIIQYIRKNFVEILLSLWVLLVICVVIYTGVERRKQEERLIRALQEIIIISTEDSQDVIIVGDPDKVNVKPKKR